MVLFLVLCDLPKFGQLVASGIYEGGHWERMLLRAHRRFKLPFNLMDIMVFQY
jgi:hypothetical protein